ncbi:hypothetical protein [Sphingomonas sp. Leaf4]|uniref:hypothetical protein n=1 Tax=Sphingomonas sp. Leaf4 TaxID=2876553 RepID=UPI001E2B1E31|nr:hypothetical protein [Sphingomonas sp. Leaf4]
MSTPFAIEKASTPFRVEKREGVPFAVQLQDADRLEPLVQAAAAAASRADSKAISAGLAADVAQAMANFQSTRAEGVAAFPVGAYFSSAETGSTRVYKRIAAAPGYEDQGDNAAPVSRQNFAPTAAGLTFSANLFLTDRDI